MNQPAPEAPALPAALAPYEAAIRAHLAQPAAWFVPLNQLAATPQQSRVGGWPYLPTGAANPLLDHGAHRFNLLVQLNLAELPALPRPFPAQGVLQVFTREVDDVLDEEQRAIRWVHYPEVLTDAAALVTDFSAYDLADVAGYEHVPAQGLALTFRALSGTGVAPGNDCGGLAPLVAAVADSAEQARLLTALTAYLEACADTAAEPEPAFRAEIAAQYPPGPAGQPVFASPAAHYSFSLPDHQAGGLLPQFWQGDPRAPHNFPPADRPPHDQLLLAYDARGNCTEWAVPFLGHDAKLLFFINHDQLARLDFSDVLFSYMG